jgi:hypothetical protein
MKHKKKCSKCPCKLYPSSIYKKLCYAHIYPRLRHLTNQWHDRRHMELHLTALILSSLYLYITYKLQKEPDSRRQSYKMVSPAPKLPIQHPASTHRHIQPKHPTQNITPLPIIKPKLTTNQPNPDSPNNFSNNPLPPNLPRRRNRVRPHWLDPKHSSGPLSRLRLPPRIPAPAHRPILRRGVGIAGFDCVGW